MCDDGAIRPALAIILIIITFAMVVVQLEDVFVGLVVANNKPDRFLAHSPIVLASFDTPVVVTFGKPQHGHHVV